MNVPLGVVSVRPKCKGAGYPAQKSLSQEPGQHIGFQEGDMMKSMKKIKSEKSEVRAFAFCLFTFASVLCSLIFMLCGCGLGGPPGETVKEADRKHKRNLRVNRQEMVADMEKVLLIDKPSRLNDKRIP